MPERIDGDSIVVTGHSPGSHFPREEKLLNFSWEANGNSDEGPFNVDGSVYGKNLRFVGPGTIHGTVLGRGDVTLKNHSVGQQQFFGGLSSHGSIVVAGKAKPIQETLNGGVQKSDIVIRGPVVAHNVTLENAIVFGRIEADTVRLVNCIVMGAVVAEGQLTCTASTLFYYNAKDVTFEGPCTMIHAMGDSRTSPVFAPYEDGSGNIWPADIRLYAVFRSDGSLTNRPWNTPSPNYTAAELSRNDWVRVDTTRRERQKTDHGFEYVDVPVERFYLTIAGRCLNFANLQKNISDLSTLLEHAFNYDHYSPQTQAEVHTEWKSMCTHEEFQLMKMVTQPKEIR